MAKNNAINYNSAVPLPASQGGTGDSTLTVHGVLVGEGTSAATVITAGTTGQLLIGATSSDPAFGTSADGNFTFTTATAGATRTLTVSNTDNTNAASNANVSILSTEAGATSKLNCTVTGTHSCTLVGNPTLLLQIGGTTIASFTAAGIRTYPGQSSSCVRKTSNTSNATGDGTNATVTTYTSMFTRNLFFSGSGSNLGGTNENVGIYLMACQGSVSSTAAMTSGKATLNSTQHVMLFNHVNAGAVRNASNNFTGVRGAALMNMASGDSVHFTIQFSGSTKTASIQGVTGGNVISYFCGAQIA